MGKSGRAMIEALIAGETNPAKLASLASRRVKASPEELREVLRGHVTKHHRFLLRLHLNQIDTLDAAMATVDAQVEANLGPLRTAVDLIMSIPGIKNIGAQSIVSEIGIDMSRFPSAAHLISWACICPRNDESAGRRRSNRLRKGATWLKPTLVQCSWAAVKKKDGYLQALPHQSPVRPQEGLPYAEGRDDVWLLLHSNPVNHVTWYAIAARLAKRYNVVLADLRGYGDSSLPEPGPNHINYSFRAMAQDMIEVMESLGHRRFFSLAMIAAHARATAYALISGPGHEALPLGHVAELLRLDPRKQSLGHQRLALGVPGATGTVS
jgi:hypothetical protein